MSTSSHIYREFKEKHPHLTWDLFCKLVDLKPEATGRSYTDEEKHELIDKLTPILEEINNIKKAQEESDRADESGKSPPVQVTQSSIAAEINSDENMAKVFINKITDDVDQKVKARAEERLKIWRNVFIVVTILGPLGLWQVLGYTVDKSVVRKIKEYERRADKRIHTIKKDVNKVGKLINTRLLQWQRTSNQQLRQQQNDLLQRFAQWGKTYKENQTQILNARLDKMSQFLRSDMAKSVSTKTKSLRKEMSMEVNFFNLSQLAFSIKHGGRQFSNTDRDKIMEVLRSLKDSSTIKSKPGFTAVLATIIHQFAQADLHDNLREIIRFYKKEAFRDKMTKLLLISDYGQWIIGNALPLTRLPKEDLTFFSELLVESRKHNLLSVYLPYQMLLEFRKAKSHRTKTTVALFAKVKYDLNQEEKMQFLIQLWKHRKSAYWQRVPTARGIRIQELAILFFKKHKKEVNWLLELVASNQMLSFSLINKLRQVAVAGGSGSGELKFARDLIGVLEQTQERLQRQKPKPPKPTYTPPASRPTP